MSCNFGSRVERRFLEIEQRMRKAGVGKEVAQPEERISTNYVDEKVNNYLFYLKKAYQEAPCSGCKKLVFSAIIGGRIYQKMSGSGVERKDISDNEIEKIRRDVERELERER